jgi:hypothetical protein
MGFEVRSQAVGAFFLGGVLWTLAAAVLPCGAEVLAGQAPAIPAPAVVPAVPVPTDTAAARVPLSGIGREAATSASLRPAWQRDKSPRTAMYCSFLIPGLGQMYNERPFWAAVAAGVEFYFIGSWVVEQRLTNRYRAISNADPTYEDAKVLFALHRDDRIQAQWLLGLTIVLSGIQSYVDAALSDFDTSPLPLQLAPDAAPGRAGLALRVRF